MYFLIRCFVLFFLSYNSLFALSISPVRIVLSQDEPVGALTLSNDSQESIVLQLHTDKWLQPNGNDLLLPSEDILTTPRIFTLKPYESQIIRLGMEAPLTRDVEQAYRLIIEEVKSPYRMRKKGIQFIINLSVPVIIQSLAPINQNVKWHIIPSKGKQPTKLEAINAGNNVIFINHIHLQLFSDKNFNESISTFSYLLPGSRKTWPIKYSKYLTRYHVDATINNHTVKMDVL